MNRKQFIKTCGMACLGGLSLGLLAESCISSSRLSSTIKGDDLIIPLTHFSKGGADKAIYRSYVIVHHELLQYPVCVYRISAQEYCALWMKCTHQGAELTAFGDKLVCAAHGSEFNNRGEVNSAPAQIPLRRFPVTIANDHLKISLKAI